MKKRQRWSIGLVLAFFVLCLVTWKVSEPRRFGFMEGAKRTWFHVQYGSGPPIAVEDFELNKQVSDVRPIVDSELLPLGFLRENIPFYSAGSVDYERPWPDDPDHSQHITLYAEGSRTRIGTTRAPTLVDHVSWFFIRLMPGRP